MQHLLFNQNFISYLYSIEENVARIFADFYITFSPVSVSGDIVDAGLYNLPATRPVTVESVTYKAAGVPVSDTYTGTTLWSLLADAGGVVTSTAKNDILSKYVIATGSDGYRAVFSLGEIDPAFGNQPVLVAYADTAGQLGSQGSDGLARIVVPGDLAGGRYISELVSLQVGSLPDPALAALGVRQAEATRDFLAGLRLTHCFTSPLRRAAQTAAVVAAPHGLTPVPLAALTECDVGRWEGLDWETVHALDPDGHARFHADPAAFGYPGGESFGQVHDRVRPALDDLLVRYAGGAVLVVAHHVVNRTYLAGLLGLDAGRARKVVLDNCGISVVVRRHGKTAVGTLNAAFHLEGVAA